MAATIRDVAKLSGTSVSSVSKVLNGSRSKTSRIGEQTRARILAAAAQLEYVSNPIAQSLATGRAGAVGIILPYADAFIDENPFCMTILQGLMREAIRHHLNVTLFTAIEGVSARNAAELIDSRVDGIVLVMPDDTGPIVDRLAKLGMPYVSVLRRPRANTWTVNSDDYHGGRLAAEHLVGLGHRKLLHLAGNPRVMTATPRCAGFTDAAREGGAEVVVMDAGFDWAQGYSATLESYSNGRRPATAIFAANDLCAIGAMKALNELGIRVPEEVALVGYDDTARASQVHPSLTSVSMGVDHLGQTALAVLVDILAERPNVLSDRTMPVSLTIRQSCGALKAADPTGQ